MSVSLSVVVPVYNEASHLPATIEALVAAIERSGFEAELVLVDDGSTDGSADVVRRTVADRLALRLVSQPNRGRFEARRAGLESAAGHWVLLLDGRVRLDPSSLEFVRGRIEGEARIWNGHVEVESEGNPYGAFWKLLAELAWADYFDDPRETSFGSEDFDRFPKGTTCFFAPRRLLLDAVAAFRPYYVDARFVSDDTALIRWLAARERIHVSPEFACRYAPRTNLTAFLKQAVYRGSTFVDGHARPESRFFPVAVAFFPVSAALALVALRRPSVVPVLAVAGGIAAGAYAAAARRSPFETISFGLLVPPYSVAHGLGMWRGLAMILGERVRRHPAARGSTVGPPRPREDVARP